MKKIKLFILFFITSMSVFIYLDNKAYYYGFGKGLLSDKIPSRFSILFAGSDLGNQGIILKENDMNLHIIRKNSSIFTDNTKKTVYIQKFIGFWFDNKTIVANIKNERNESKYIEIYEEATNSWDSQFICNEIKFKPYELNYIDLDKSLIYFKRFKLIKNIVFFITTVLFVYVIKLLVKYKKTNVLDMSAQV